MKVGCNLLFAILTVVITVLNGYICLREVFHYRHSLRGTAHVSPRTQLFTRSSAEMHINVAAYLKTNLCEAIKNITIGYNAHKACFRKSILPPPSLSHCLRRWYLHEWRNEQELRRPTCVLTSVLH